MSSTVILQLMRKLFRMRFLKALFPGHPNSYCNFRAKSALAICLLEYKLLLYSTVLSKVSCFRFELELTEGEVQ